MPVSPAFNGRCPYFAVQLIAVPIFCKPYPHENKEMEIYSMLVKMETYFDGEYWCALGTT